MKKLILFILILVVVLIVAVYLSMDVIIKEAIQKYVPPVTQTRVEVSSVHTDLMDGEITIKGLMIANPIGYSMPHAFTLGKIEVKVDIKSLFKNTIIIKEIDIEKPVATFEISQSGINVLQLNKNVNAYLNKNASDKPTTDSSGKSSKKVVIRHLTFEDGAIQLASSITTTQKSVTIPLPKIEMSNIGQENAPVKMEQAIAQILSTFSEKSLETFKSQALKFIPQMPKELSDLSTTLQEAKKQLNETKENFESVGTDLKNMFSK